MRLWLVNINYALNDVFMKMDKSIDEKCKKLNYRKSNELSDFAYQFKFNLKNEKNYEHRSHGTFYPREIQRLLKIMSDLAVSICVLSDDFSKLENLPEIIAPEALLNGKQIQEWVSNLRANPKIFATNSLYLLRELELQEIPVMFIHWVNGESHIVYKTDDLENLEILTRELEQSDRYLRNCTNI